MSIMDIEGIEGTLDNVLSALDNKPNVTLQDVVEQVHGITPKLCRTNELEAALCILAALEWRK